MKIIKIISAHRGRGGHFHSLYTIAKEMSFSHSVYIIVIGPGESEILNQSELINYNVNFNGLNIFSAIQKLNDIVNDINPDIIHCYDIICYSFIRISKSVKNYRLILSKCGGPFLKRFPFCKDIVLFHEEDHEKFKRSTLHKLTNFYVIPNRINYENITTITNPFINYTRDKFVFIRICRIGKEYLKSINQAINLEKELENKGLKVCLIVIGNVEDQNILIDLKKNSLGYNIHFFFDDEYTVKASAYIRFADAVIGVGRSFMESAAMSKPTLCFVSNKKFPILINSASFEQALYYNFSERVVIQNINDEKNFSEIEDLVLNTKTQELYGRFSKELYDKFFSIHNGIQRYYDIYYKLNRTKQYSTLLEKYYFILWSIRIYFKMGRQKS